MLGEDNEKRLKDAITDALIDAVKKDIEEQAKYEYIFDVEQICDEVRKEIEDDFKTRLMAKYMAHADAEVDKIFGGKA